MLPIDPLPGYRARLSGTRYLIVVPVPWTRDPDGGVWLDPLWLIDLRRHCDYLADLVVLAPRQSWTGAPPAGAERLDPVPGLRFRALPAPGGLARAALTLPVAAVATLRAVAGADVVHSGVAGWPLPPGLLANPLAVLLRKRLVIVIESAFWRVSDATASRKAHLRHSLTEALARWSVRRADLSIFTHDVYRQQLSGGARGQTVVAPASWLDARDLLPDDQIGASWLAKPQTPRFLFAGRLEPAKGVPVLLAALEQLDRDGPAIHLDLIGSGTLGDAVDKAAGRFRHVHLRRLAPVPYGAPFLTLLRGYHALVVPSISDEQPRVLYDAFSQAVPAIVSDTAGHRAVAAGSEAAIIVAPDDPADLARALAKVAVDPSGLPERGRIARHLAEGRTHEAMHRERAALLAELFGKAAA